MERGIHPFFTKFINIVAEDEQNHCKNSLRKIKTVKLSTPVRVPSKQLKNVRIRDTDFMAHSMVC